MGAQWYDALIALPGCDKNMPGCLMAMGRLNRPALMVYGGTIKPGCTHDGRSQARHRLGVSVLTANTSPARSPKRSGSEIVRSSMSRRRRLRRHVHGQHDGLGDRSAGHVAALQLVDSGRRSGASSTNASPPARRFAPAGKRHQAARHHDPRGVRERDGRRDGARRLDQRRAASDRDGPRRWTCR